MYSREELLNVYKIAIEEYRFEVNLHWEQAKFYVGLNVGVLTIATGLFKLGTPVSHYSILVSVLFFIGIFTSLLGVFSIKQSKQYYHRTVYKKTLIERELGLLEYKSEYSESVIDLSVSPTSGMQEKANILKGDEYIKKDTLRPGTIKYYIAAILYMLSVLNCIGFIWIVVASITQYIHNTLP